MPWPKTKKNPATNNSNREILDRLDRIIELLEQPRPIERPPEEIATKIAKTIAEQTQKFTLL